MEQELVDLESSLNVGEAAEVPLCSLEQKSLASLGYVGGATREAAPTENNLPDVKDMLPFNLVTQVAIAPLHQGNFADAEQALRKIVAESPPKHISSRLYLASVYESRGNFSAAEDIYKAVLERRPEDSTALFQLGVSYAEQGRFKDAISTFEKCFAEDKDSTEPLFNLGLAKSRIGDIQAAEQIFRRVLKLDPMFPEAWAALGTLLAATGRAETAKAAFESEMKINPESIEANITPGVQPGGQQRFQESHKYLFEAVKLAPERMDARFSLAICHEILQNYEAAVSHSRKQLRNFLASGIRSSRIQMLVRRRKSWPCRAVFRRKLLQ